MMEEAERVYLNTFGKKIKDKAKERERFLFN